MARPGNRVYGVPKLSDHRGGKIAVICSKCGMERRYDANAMLERIEDMPVPLLLIEIAKAEGARSPGARVTTAACCGTFWHMLRCSKGGS